ncbi:hypothetical protein PLICRDRAFT_179039 [Plicaturopsis crispa FD-325 SS-3]|uniref:Uncharacterized protein n=1 Tax=Plicaturopsis crispa FD-325 SS-3 TaxID=944288 RepID=A0A0C9TAI2_PLICR|nr:hypothetical protein PLICRDRAFT_179039 [Plicaturopsis crispa FD-325 SS-3]
MSASPRPHRISNGDARSPKSNAELAAMLSTAYTDLETIKNELAGAHRRAEKAERLVAALTANNHSAEESARLAMEAETRVEMADRARDEANGRRRIIMESWAELERYLQVIDIRAADARTNFGRIVQEGGGHLVLSPIPLIPSPHPPAPSNASFTTTTLQPSATYSSFPASAPTHAQHATQRVMPPPPRTLNTLPLPPPPRIRRSSDESSQIIIRGSGDEHSRLRGNEELPPAKKARSSRHDPDDRAQIYAREHDSEPYQSAFTRPPSSSSSASLLHQHPHSRQSPLRQSQGSIRHEVPRGRGRKRRAGSRSRSRSVSSSRSVGSSNIDDVILEAATDRRSQQGDVGGGIVTYQTHVFAPPVTGAPIKKSKYNPGGGSSSSLAAPSSTTSIPVTSSSSAPRAAVVPPQVPSQPQKTYPATNEAGQRLCRQCGLAGRYKEGKCVEKWGPGPLGPGTVCDRCRKKMKRVERRGTLDGSMQQLIPGQMSSSQLISHVSRQPPDRSIHRTDTMPVHHSPRIGPGGTQLINSSPPPAIATLDVEMDAPPARHKASPAHREVVPVDSEQDADADADADADGDADADAEAESEVRNGKDSDKSGDGEDAALLEAVDAATA